ncbi:diguanylate cyclase [Thiocystis violascens]|uniref:diguanylate cyclase n=1 Tax=Thiocystis violascens (strain ATCC 17096 / DSM 198 / 6111) TaxID=765911 RepID=I3Y585_THIV6|nr:diguanylate cyclase [Thiocystis violascens]AFL72153.1 diguanylate cyclase (GGDEF) domain-containing protein [Thiocystis violascens DSM 198]
MHLTIRRKFFLSHFFAVLLVSGSIGSYFYLSAVSSLTTSIQLRLENTAALVGQILEARELDRIRAPADRERPEYQRHLALLRTLERTNPDIAFLYVMRHDGSQVTFVLDSDPSERQATPGQIYASHTPSLLRGFQHPSVDDRLYTDDWGSFMSGYAPLRNGNGEYLVGLDLRAEEFARKLQDIRIAGGLSLVLSILLAFAFSHALSAQMLRPVRMLIARCRRIATGELDRFVELRNGDELEQLVDAFNAMFMRLAESRAHADGARAALQQARDHLEQRIGERTRELVDLNARLLREVAERARAEELLAHSARSDPLTGLMNRRAMLEHLEYQATRFERSQTPFVLGMGDLDHFKAVNDAHGHDAGDQALVQTAACLTQSLRAQDLVARWGGEEFLILLPETDLDGGARVAEKVRETIAATALDIGPTGLRLTISLGLAAYGPGQTLGQCIKAADEALYTAKRQGRNRIVVAGSAAVESKSRPTS